MLHLGNVIGEKLRGSRSPSGVGVVTGPGNPWHMAHGSPQISPTTRSSIIAGRRGPVLVHAARIATIVPDAEWAEQAKFAAFFQIGAV